MEKDTISYKFPSENKKLIDQCVVDLTGLKGWKLLEKKEEDGMTELVFRHNNDIEILKKIDQETEA